MRSPNRFVKSKPGRPAEPLGLENITTILPLLVRIFSLDFLFFSMRRNEEAMGKTQVTCLPEPSERAEFGKRKLLLELVFLKSPLSFFLPHSDLHMKNNTEVVGHGPSRVRDAFSRKRIHGGALTHRTLFG